MTVTRPDCQLVGAGRAGRALSLAMVRAGYRFTWIGSKVPGDAERLALETGAGAYGFGFDSMPRPAGFLIIAVPDDAIENVARDAAAAGIVQAGATIAAHLSGARGSGALESLRSSGASVMAFHPAQSFTGDNDPSSVFEGICFDMEGDDTACLLGERITVDLGAEPVRLSQEQRILTHLAMTIASNYTISLIRMAETVVSHAGIEPETAEKMLRPLYTNTITNVALHGTLKALTGPVSRGDADVVRKHLETLAAMDENYREAYGALARIALQMAVERGDIGTDGARMIEDVLKGRL